MKTSRNSPTLGTSNSYVASTLRKDFQVSFVIYIPNTLVGCTNVNSIELIKSKGDSAFP
jgi:flagellar biosynthesis protein FliP